MAVLLFVLFWVLVAVALVVIGVRSGRGGAPPKVNTSRGGRAYWYVGFAIILLGFGIGVPVASSLGRNDSARSDAQAGVTRYTAAQEHGRALFHQQCAMCHSLKAAAAVAQVGPNLDNLRPTKALTLDAIHKGRARGNGAMAANLYTGQDAEDVADFVAAAVGQSGK